MPLKMSKGFSQRTPTISGVAGPRGWPSDAMRDAKDPGLQADSLKREGVAHPPEKREASDLSGRLLRDEGTSRAWGVAPRFGRAQVGKDGQLLQAPASTPAVFRPGSLGGDLLSWKGLSPGSVRASWRPAPQGHSPQRTGRPGFEDGMPSAAHPLPGSLV